MTEEQWEGLLEWLACGHSCLTWCKKQEPEKYETIRSQIYCALKDDEELANKYARAKSFGIEARLDLAREVACSEDVNRARLIIDLDKWEASKLLPKKYGDRQTIALEDVNSDTLLDALRKEK